MPFMDSDHPLRTYETLDAILVVGTLLVGAFIIWSLVYIEIPQAQLPIIAGLGGTILGIDLTYAAFRFQIPKKGVDTAAGIPGALELNLTTTPAKSADSTTTTTTTINSAAKD